MIKKIKKTIKKRIAPVMLAAAMISAVPVHSIQADPFTMSYSLKDYTEKEIVKKIALEIRHEDNALYKETAAEKEKIYTKYALTGDQLRILAGICVREQGGNIVNIKACASHMCNYHEMHRSGKYPSPFETVVYSGWYGSSGRNLSMGGYATQEAMQAVYDVICNGRRTLPPNIDEFDCLSDIVSASNGGVSFNPMDRSQYISGQTIIRNRYGSTYLFYAFPDGAGGVSDAFGTTHPQGV